MVTMSRNVVRNHAMYRLLTGDMAPATSAAEIVRITPAIGPELPAETVVDMAQRLT